MKTLEKKALKLIENQKCESKCPKKIITYRNCSECMHFENLFAWYAMAIIRSEV